MERSSQTTYRKYIKYKEKYMRLKQQKGSGFVNDKSILGMYAIYAHGSVTTDRSTTPLTPFLVPDRKNIVFLEEYGNAMSSTKAKALWDFLSILSSPPSSVFGDERPLVLKLLLKIVSDNIDDEVRNYTYTSSSYGHVKIFETVRLKKSGDLINDLMIFFQPSIYSSMDAFIKHNQEMIQSGVFSIPFGFNYPKSYCSGTSMYGSLNLNMFIDKLNLNSIHTLDMIKTNIGLFQTEINLLRQQEKTRALSNGEKLTLKTLNETLNLLNGFMNKVEELKKKFTSDDVPESVIKTEIENLKKNLNAYNSYQSVLVPYYNNLYRCGFSGKWTNDREYQPCIDADTCDANHKEIYDKIITTPGDSNVSVTIRNSAEFTPILLSDLLMNNIAQDLHGTFFVVTCRSKYDTPAIDYSPARGVSELSDINVVPQNFDRFKIWAITWASQLFDHFKDKVNEVIKHGNRLEPGVSMKKKIYKTYISLLKVVDKQEGKTISESLTERIDILSYADVIAEVLIEFFDILVKFSILHEEI